jgi:hypothetical protein
LLRKLKFEENLTLITDMLREDFCKFMKITLRTLLEVRNVSEKGRNENQNTRFMFNKFV